MAKYYVQSGTLKAVLSAESEDRAALWVVHRAMQQIMPIYEDQGLTAQQKCDTVMVEGLIVLDPTIRMSEIGFDREDAAVAETFEVVAEWHQLMIALEKLERLLR